MKMQHSAQDQRFVGRAAVSGKTSISLALLLTTLAGSTAVLGQTTHPESAVTPPVATAPAAQATGTNTATTQGTPAIPNSDSKVTIDPNNIVDLHVNDEDLGNVLEMLSIQSQKNIIASKNVSARVTANLYGVTFYEALDAILHVNGYGYVPNGNFIMIYTLEELKALEIASRQRVSKVIPLNYLSSTDAAEFVKPLLSIPGAGGMGGEIKVNGKVANFPAMGEVPTGNEEYANNSMLVVYDYEENVAEIEALVKQIDTRPAQVLVEATIMQTDLSENNAFGVDFSLIADMDFSDFVSIGGPLQAANALIGGRNGAGSSLPADGMAQAVSSTVGGTTGPGGLKVGIVSNDVAVFLRVLDEVTDTTILSNPKILALNRQPSRVLVGRKVGFVSTTSTDTASTQTVKFLDTGTQLYFRPFVTNEGMIRMELKPQVSEAVIRESNNPSGGSITIPDEITNELSTNVLVRDGQTIVLGGLFRESTESTRKQVPLLGDIPIIGSAFRGHDDEVRRNEIIFMITPTIVNDTALAGIGDKGKQVIEHARAGAREGTLFFGRDRLTSRINVEAETLAAEGQNDKALWYINRSLAMNARQPEAIELREKLAGKKTNWPDRSLLERILRTETGKRSDASTTFNPNSLLNNTESTTNTTTSAFDPNSLLNTDTVNTAQTTDTTPTTQVTDQTSNQQTEPNNTTNELPEASPNANVETETTPVENIDPLSAVTPSNLTTETLANAGDTTVFFQGLPNPALNTTDTANLWLGTSGVTGSFWAFFHSLQNPMLMNGAGFGTPSTVSTVPETSFDNK